MTILPDNLDKAVDLQSLKGLLAEIIVMPDQSVCMALKIVTSTFDNSL
jgi:hypothetical protein